MYVLCLVPMSSKAEAYKLHQGWKWFSENQWNSLILLLQECEPAAVCIAAVVWFPYIQTDFVISL